MPVPGLPFSDRQLFTALNAVLPAWLLLAVAPKWRVTIPLVTATAAAYALLYVLLFCNAIFSGDAADMDMFSYEGVARLLASQAAVLPAWTHYIVFDLWVGRWEVIDAQMCGVPQVVMVVPLFLTMMAGPAGLLLYLAAIRPWYAPKQLVAGQKLGSKAV